MKKLQMQEVQKINYPENTMASFKGDKENSPLYQFGYFLLNKLKIKKGNQVDVTKLYVTEESYNLLNENMINWAVKYKKYREKEAKSAASMSLFMSGPAVDYHNKYNCSNNYVVVLPDFEKEPREGF